MSLLIAEIMGGKSAAYGLLTLLRNNKELDASEKAKLEVTLYSIIEKFDYVKEKLVGETT